MKKILYGIVLFLFSCSSSPSLDNYERFPREEELTSQVIKLDTALFRYPFRLRVDRDKVTVMDLHGTDHCYHLFQYPEFHYLGSFGRRGDSPQEMLSAENIRYSDDAIWTLDANKSELAAYEWASPGDSLLRKETISLHSEILRALDFVMYDDSTFIIPDYSGESRFCWVDRTGKLLRKTGILPTHNEELLASSAPAMAQAWRSFIDYNPRNGVLVAVTQLGEVLEIYNLNSNTHIVRYGPHGEPEFKLSGGYAVPSGIMGFSDVQVTDQAIYAVFHGRTFKELTQQKERVDGGKYIYKFSLAGEPICKYVLDRFIYGIYVDEENGIIIGTNVNNDQPIASWKI